MGAPIPRIQPLSRELVRNREYSPSNDELLSITAKIHEFEVAFKAGIISINDFRKCIGLSPHTPDSPELAALKEQIALKQKELEEACAEQMVEPDKPSHRRLELA